MMDPSLFDANAFARTLAERAVPTAAFAVAFSQSGSRCAVGTRRGTVHCFDVPALLLEQSRRAHTPRATSVTLAHTGAVFSLCFLDDERLLTAGDDGRVCVWQMKNEQSGKLLREWRLESRQMGATVPEVNAVACDVTRSLVWAAAGGGALHAWDLTSGNALGNTPLDAHGGGGALCMTMAPTSGSVVSGGADGTVKLWDVRASTAAARQTLAVPGGGAVRCVAASRDEQWLAAGGDGRAACVWHCASSQLVSALPHAAPVGALRFVQPGDVGVGAADTQNVLGNAAAGSGGVVTGDLGSSSLNYWRLDGTLRMRVATSCRDVYGVALNEHAKFYMLAACGTAPTVDIYLGDLTKRAFSLSVAPPTTNAMY
eukprot:TRINITY_DN4562_c0_g1_i1.p1 TRINITY_DN4562_c0_g1~~TRINITY_DN4562_c0_g1_i1.p1  ORF type:complete len:405 (-),score=139.76 TRINITY_DN4562_c0_g1_i1:37-1149(-)